MQPESCSLYVFLDINRGYYGSKKMRQTTKNQFITKFCKNRKFIIKFLKNILYGNKISSNLSRKFVTKMKYSGNKI